MKNEIWMNEPLARCGSVLYWITRTRVFTSEVYSLVTQPPITLLFTPYYSPFMLVMWLLSMINWKYYIPLYLDYLLITAIYHQQITLASMYYDKRSETAYYTLHRQNDRWILVQLLLLWSTPPLMILERSPNWPTGYTDNLSFHISSKWKTSAGSVHIGPGLSWGCTARCTWRGV